MQTTIENKGITKTIINRNGDKNENEIRWKADYDGEKADVFALANVLFAMKFNRYPMKIHKKDVNQS
jgi:hypothetical protein